jgi:hypothetical protein
MNLPTADQAKAAGRHVLTAGASIIGTLAALKVLSGGDATSLQNSLNQIGHGTAEILTAVTAISVTLSGVYSALSANPLWQLLRGSKAIAANPSLAVGVTVADQASVATAAQQMPEVQTIIASPAVAMLSPSNGVVSS